MTRVKTIELDRGAAFQIVEYDAGGVTLRYRPVETHPGWPRYEAVCDLTSMEQAERWVERPPPWWTQPMAEYVRSSCMHCGCSVSLDGWGEWIHDADGATACSPDRPSLATPWPRCPDDTCRSTSTTPDDRSTNTWSCLACGTWFGPE